MVLYGPQGNSLGLLYALANKFTVFSQVYSTTGKQVSPPSSPSAALANFLYQPTLCLMQNFSPITYLSKGIRWLLCECKLVTIIYRSIHLFVCLSVCLSIYLSICLFIYLSICPILSIYPSIYLFIYFGLIKSVPFPSVGHDRCKILPRKTAVTL